MAREERLELPTPGFGDQWPLPTELHPFIGAGGIGLPLYDYSAEFGSSGRLQGYVDMAALSRYSLVQQESRFQFTLKTLAHELMHRWGSHLGFRDAAGNSSTDLIGPDQSHWSYFLDTDASVMYGNDWNARADGSFESVAALQRFSALDLYSAGLYASSEVPAFNLIRGGTGSATDLPRPGAVSGGSLESITIDQVIAESGPRNPTAAESQKDFRAAFILLKRPGEQVSAATTLALEQLRTRAQQYFSQITRSRANLRIFTTRDQATGAGLPQILVGSGATTTPPGVAGAIAWLEARQLPDGHWQDHPSTALRDTIAAVEALQELDPGFAGLAAARGWIAVQTPANLDDTARRWALGASAADDTAIEQAQTGSGWSLVPAWPSSSYDTALIAETRASRGNASVSLSPTLASLTAFQRADGAFAHVANGRGRVMTTARAAAALAALPDPVFDAARGRAVSWLEQRLLEFNGTTTDELLTLPDFVELYVRAGTVPLSGPGAETIRQRIRTTQQVAGDWSGSVYLTATAALARARDQRGNLAVVGSPMATPANPSDGQRVLLSATVVNSGNVPVPASVLRWFNGDPDQGGTQIGNDAAVSALSANARVTISTNWTTTGQAGVRNLWLVLDATGLVEETSELDNRAELVVTVQSPSSQPDLTLDENDVHFTPGSVTSLPSPVQLSASLRNIGLQSASAALVRLSVVRNGQRTALAEARVDVPPQSQVPIELAFNATTAEALQLILEADPDQEIAEGSEDNNSVALVLPYGPSLDLEVTDADLGFDPGSPAMVGRDMRLAMHLHNRGTIDSPPVQIQAEIVQGATRYPLAVSAAQVPAGQSVVRIVTWRPTVPGSAQLQVAIDPLNQLVETREDNNGAQFDFTIADATQPDLTIVSSSVAFAPEIALQGQPLTATLNVRNLGQELNQSFAVGLYASDPRRGAAPLAEVQVPSLGAGTETPVMLHVPDWPLSGDTNLFLVVDAASLIAESDEENNRVVKLLRSLALPDLAVSLAGITLTPALPVAGEPVQARVTVRNLGAQDAASFGVRLYEGEAATGAEVPAAQTVPGLAAGASIELVWDWTLGLASNARQVTVVVDGEGTVREGSTDNNVAMLPFDVQNTNFFASERYISPNGDGIKDATSVVVRLEQNEPVSMRVLNGAQYVVRDFGAVSIDSALRGQVVWDGRDDRGRIAPDGDYRVTAFSASQQVLGTAVVTVDNNRSSVFEAIGTPYEVASNLPDMQQVAIPPSNSVYRHQLFGTASRSVGNQSHRGLYRTDTLFPSLEPIISSSWLEAYRQANSLQYVDVGGFSLNPDGRSIAFLLSVQANSGPTRWALYSTRVDLADAPALVFQAENLVGDTLVHINAQQVAVRLNDASRQLLVIDLANGSSRPFRTIPPYPSDIKALPDGLLVTSFPGTLTFYPFNEARPEIPLLADGAGEADQRNYQLSPDRRSIVLHTRSEALEGVEHVNLMSGVRKKLREVQASVTRDAIVTNSEVRLDVLDVGWLEREGVLVLVDGRERRIETFNSDGGRISALPLGVLDRVGAYAAVPGSRFLGAVQQPRSVQFNSGCQLYQGRYTLGVERRTFDPTNGRMYLGLGEKAIYVQEEYETYLYPTDGVIDYRSVGLRDNDDRSEFSASGLSLESPADTSRYPLVAQCPEDRPGSWPELILSDGARLRSDQRVETLSRGVSADPWLESEGISEFWPDETRLLLGSSRSVASLLNGVAVVRAQSLGRGIELSGVASDRNFAYYELDWAPIEQPDNWQVLTTAIPDQVFIDEFLTWVPPQPGTFKVRLRVVDRAGNATTDTTIASSLSGSPIDSFALAPRYFSPNGDGTQDELIARFRVRQPATLDLRIETTSGQPVRSLDLTYGATDLGTQEFHWDGRDDAGSSVVDGRYRFRLAGFAAWVTVDTVAPALGGDIRQGYRSSCNTNGSCVVDIDPGVRWAVAETNPRTVVIEARSPGSNVWNAASSELNFDSHDVGWAADQRNWALQRMQLDQVAGQRVRLQTIDLAGNSASLELGDMEQGLWLHSHYAPPVATARKYRFAFHAPPFSVSPVTTSGQDILVDRSDDTDRLAVADGVLGLTQVSVETAPVEEPGQWTDRGSYPIAYANSANGWTLESAKQRSLNLPFEADSLVLGGRYLVRLSGTRADGTSIHSNIGSIRIGGMELPGVSDGSEPGVCDVSVREYYDGPLSSATLVRGSNANPGSQTRTPATSIDDDFAYFESIPADGIAWVEALDSSGRQHRSESVLITCHPDTDPDHRPKSEVNQFIVLRDRCDGIPSGQTGLAFWTTDDRVRRIRLRHEDGITQQMVAAYEQDGQGGSVIVNTEGWSEGQYQATLDGDRGNGFELLARGRFIVESAPPEVEMLQPSDGSRVCTSQFPGPNNESDWSSLQTQVNVRSADKVGYRFELGRGATPLEWSCKESHKEGLPPQDELNLNIRGECVPYETIPGPNGASLSGAYGGMNGHLEAFNGISTIRLRAVNWSGGPVCTTSTVFLDSAVELLEVRPPDRLIPGAPHRSVGIAAAGDPDYAAANFHLRADEVLDIHTTVHRGQTNPQTGKFELLPEVLGVLGDLRDASGAVEIAWDGRLGGDMVPDGLYGLRVEGSDGCVHKKAIEYTVLVDSTPPLVQITSPTAGASITTGVVEIDGSASDINFARWSVDVMSAATSGSWLSLAVGLESRPDAGVLAQWQRGNAVGPAQIRLRAYDVFGNMSESVIPVELAAPPQLIGSASTQPLLFSPNGDGVLDISQIFVGLLQPVTLDISVGGRTLFAGAAPVGAMRYDWDGRNAANTIVADGDYPVSIHASDPQGVASPEAVLLTVSVDNTVPAIDFLQPAGAHANADTGVRVRINDMHLVEYRISLKRLSDGVIVASTQGTQSGEFALLALIDQAEGEYQLSAEARDGAGNRSQRELIFTLDKTLPGVELATPADGAVLAASVATPVRGSVSDDRLATFTLAVAPESIDTWTDLASGSTGVSNAEILSWRPNLPDGRYRLRLRALDLAGNASEVVHAITIDSTPPVALITRPIEGDFVRSALEVDGTASDANFAEYRLSVARVAEPELWSVVYIGTSPVEAASLAQLTLALADGDYFLRLVVSDKAGLTTTARVQVRLRTAPPPAPLALVGHVLGNRDAFLEWQPVVHPELAGYHLYRGGSRVNVDPISLTRFTESNVPEGAAQYWVRAVDLAGNESLPSNTVTLDFDRTPPLAQLFRPADGERVRGIVSIIGTAYSQNDFKEYRLSAEPVDPPGAASELRRSPLAVEAQSLAEWSTLGLAEEARIRLHLEAEDQNGNIGSASAEVVVDNTPPAAPVGLTANLVGADGQVNWNPNSESDLLGYLLYRDGHLVNFSGSPPLDLRAAALTDTTYADVAVANGQHVFVVHAIDRAGNISPPSDPATLDPVSRPPHLTIVSPADGTLFEQLVRIDATSADLDIAEVRFSWRAATGGAWTEFGGVLTERPYRVDWVPGALAYGDYDIQAIARDSLNQSDPNPPVVRVRYADLTAPAPLASLSALADGETVNLNWPTSTAADLSSYRLERNDNDFWAFVADVQPGETSYADPSRPDGIQRYRISAVDTSNNSSTAVTADAHVFGIAFEHPYTPTTGSTLGLGASSGRPGSVSLHIVNAQGASDQQVGATDASGAFALSAMPLQMGHTEWTLTVTDADGNRSRAATIDMDRGEKPAAPIGLNAVVNDHDVSLNWSANTEPDMLGYRVLRNGQAAPPDAPLSLPITAASTAGYGASDVIDGDPATAWVVSAYEFDPLDPARDPALELSWAEPRIISAINLSWTSATNASGSLDAFAWSGHAWIRIAQLRAAAAADASLIPSRTYRTDRLRLVVHRDAAMPPNIDLQLAEVAITERNIQAGTSVSDTLLDGRYRYRVVAYNAFAFESDPSEEAVADVGDAEGPDPVVLSGTLSGADATLSWTASASSDIDHYDLVRDGSTIATVLASSPLGHVDAALSNGEHHYVVIGYDGFDNAGPPSNEVVLSVNEQGPGVPENVRVIADPAGRALDVSWQPGAGAPSVSYVVRRAQAASGPYAIVAQPSATSLHDAPLSNGVAYFYTIAAIDAAGNASAETAPISGVPQDRTAPNGTRLTHPTIAEYPVFMRATETPVCGSAEPASTVLLENSAVTVATVQARSLPSVVERPLGSGFSDIEFAPNGRLALLLGLQNVQVIRLDNLASVATLESSTRLEQWAALGSTLFYATSNDEIVRQEIGQPPEVLPIAVSSLRFFGFGADESLLVLAGDYAANGNPAESGVWIIDRDHSQAWRVAGLDPVEFETHAPKFSADGRHALLFDGNGEMVLLDLATHAVIDRFAYANYSLPAWSPDGRQFAYVAYGAAGGSELKVHDIVSQQTRVLAVDPNAIDSTAWSPFGDQIGVLRNGLLDVITAAGGQSVLPSPIRSDERVRLQWTASGRLFSHGYRPPQIVELPGQFCFESVPLLPGRNLLSASARDAAGNLGLASPAISVETPVDAVPDLSISENDILFVPASGQAGGSYSAIALVHNIGTAVARQPTLSARLVAPDGLGRSIAPAAAMPDIPAGGTVSVTLPFGVLTQAGSHRLDVVLDPAAQIRELSEANNRASRNLVLGSDARPVLTLSLGRNNFAPGETVNSELRVNNPGNAFSGSVRTRIIDAAGFSVAEFTDQPIQQLAFGALWTRAVQWSSAGIEAGSYRISAHLLDSTGAEIGYREAAFSIAVERNIVLGLDTATTQVVVGNVVAMEAAVDFRSGNATLSGARLRFSAVAPNGTEVWQVERPLGTVQPGYVLRMPQSWSTSGQAEGVYALHLQLLSTDYQASAESSISLSVEAPTAAVSGSIEILPGASVIAGVPAQARYHLGNTGGVALTGVQARLRLFDVAGNPALAEREDVVDLPTGAVASESLAIDAPRLALVPHLLLLEARLSGDAPGQWRLLAQRSVPIVDALPPVIQLLQPDIAVLQPAVVPFRANIVDVHSGVMRAEVAIDAGAWQPLALDASGSYVRALAGMGDGAHQIVVRASDRWGNESTTPPIAIDVDATPPVIAIAGVVDGDLVNHAVTPTVSVTEVHPATTEITLDGSPFVSGSTVLVDGYHVLSVRATDAAGNSSARSVRFSIDTEAPTLAITQPVDGSTTAQTSVDVVVQTEAGARVDLHTGAFNAQLVADSSGRASFASVPLLPGDNAIDATATDAAGNTGGPVAISVHVESGAGAELIGSLQPASGEVAHGSPLQIGLRLENPDSNALPQQDLRVRVLDPSTQLLGTWTLQRAFAAHEIYTDTIEFDTATWPLSALTLQLEVERAGSWVNLDMRTVTLVDRTPPMVAVVAPADAAVLRAPLTVRASASDVLSPIDLVETRIDQGDWIPLSAVSGADGEFESAPVVVDEGDHVLVVRARDTAANESTTGPVAIAIDMTDPVIAIAGVADGDVLNHNVTPVISISDAHLANSTIRLDGQPFVSGTLVDSGGVHDLDVDADDLAGNTSAAHIRFTLDFDAPLVVFTSPAPGSVLLEPSVEVTGTTEASARVNLSNAGFVAEVFADGNGVFSVPAVTLVAGDNAIVAHAVDPGGNVGPDATLNVRYEPAEAMLTGSLESVPPRIPPGSDLPVSYGLANNGVGDLADIPVRLELRPDGSGTPAAQYDRNVDLAAGTTFAESIEMPTSTLAVGDYQLVLLAYLTNGQGQSDWVTLASRSTAIRALGCGGRIPPDRIFADTFDGDADAIFCDGFEWFASTGVDGSDAASLAGIMKLTLPGPLQVSTRGVLRLLDDRLIRRSVQMALHLPAEKGRQPPAIATAVRASADASTHKPELLALLVPRPGYSAMEMH